MTRQYDLSGVSVQIAIPVNRDFPAQTVVALLDTAVMLAQRGIPHEIKMEVGGSIIERSRSLCVDNFLRSDCTHLFWIDSDVSWKADDFLKVLALATVQPCVAAVYPAKKEPPTFFLSGVTSTVNAHGCLPVLGTGLGFCCVQRKVITSLADAVPLVRMLGRDWPVPHLFRCDTVNGEFRGEDHAFFADVWSAGYEVVIEPSIELGHVGAKEYRGAVLESLQAYKVA